jgi:hypothetical protein
MIRTCEESLRWMPSVLGLSAGAITRRKLAFTSEHRVKVRWNCCPFCSVTPCTLTPLHSSKCTACKTEGRIRRDRLAPGGVEDVVAESKGAERSPLDEGPSSKAARTKLRLREFR